MRYFSELAIANSSSAAMGIELGKETAAKVAGAIKGMMNSVAKLNEAIEKEDFASEEDHMQFCAQTVHGLMDEVRDYADSLESEVADDLWPLPTYQEMLFIK